MWRLHFGNEAHALLHIVLAIKRRAGSTFKDLRLSIKHEKASLCEGSAYIWQIHAEKEIEDAKPDVPGNCCAVSIKFDKILSE